VVANNGNTAQLVIAFVTLTTAVVGSAVHLTQMRQQYNRTRRAGPKQNPLRVLSLSHDPVFTHEADPLLSLRRRLRYLRIAVLIATLIFLLYLGQAYLSFLLSGLTSVGWLILGVVNGMLALGILVYIGWAVHSLLETRKHLTRCSQEAVPLSHKSRKVSALVVGDYGTILDRCAKALEVRGTRIDYLNRDEGLIQGRHGHYPLLFLWDDIRIEIKRQEENRYLVEVASDGIRPTFGSDERRNYTVARRLLQHIVS